MIPIDFQGSNLVLNKPDSMSDEHCMSGVPAYHGIDDEGFPFFLTVWQPSKEDIEAIVSGRPVCLKIVSKQAPPVALYTYDENFDANM